METGILFRIWLGISATVQICLYAATLSDAVADEKFYPLALDDYYLKTRNLSEIPSEFVCPEFRENRTYFYLYPR